MKSPIKEEDVREKDISLNLVIKQNYIIGKLLPFSGMTQRRTFHFKPETK